MRLIVEPSRKGRFGDRFTVAQQSLRLLHGEDNMKIMQARSELAPKYA
jgi:hypothetical protein